MEIKRVHFNPCIEFFAFLETIVRVLRQRNDRISEFLHIISTTINIMSWLGQPGLLFFCVLGCHIYLILQDISLCQLHEYLV